MSSRLRTHAGSMRMYRVVARCMQAYVSMLRDSPTSKRQASFDALMTHWRVECGARLVLTCTGPCIAKEIEKGRVSGSISLSYSKNAFEKFTADARRRRRGKSPNWCSSTYANVSERIADPRCLSRPEWLICINSREVGIRDSVQIISVDQFPQRGLIIELWNKGGRLICICSF